MPSPTLRADAPAVAVVAGRLPSTAVLTDLLARTRPTIYLLELDTQLISRLTRLRAAGIEPDVRNIHDEHARIGASLPSRRTRVLGRLLGRFRRTVGTAPWAVAARRSWRAVEPPRPPDVTLPDPTTLGPPRAHEVTRPDGVVAMRERRDTRNRPFQRDYLDVDGIAYLTRWVDRSTGVARGAIALDRGRAARYSSVRSWHARWLAGALQDADVPVVALRGVGAEAVTALPSRLHRALVLEPDADVPTGAGELPVVRIDGSPVQAVLRAVEVAS